MPLSQAPAAPPRAKTPKTSGATTAHVSRETPRDKIREESLAGIGQAISMALLMRGNFADAGAIGIHGPKVVRETVAMARNSEPVGRALDMLSQATPYTGLIFAGLPLLAQLAVNHGRIPPERAAGIQGVVSPQILENKMKAELAEMEMQALREQREAEEQLARLTAEQEASRES
jgi:hypothetical protein